MTLRYRWVDELEMFSLAVVRGLGPVDLAAILTDRTATPVAGLEAAWPTGQVRFVTGERDGCAYALAFDSGLLTSRGLDEVSQQGEAVSLWLDIHANSELALHRGGSVVRRFEVIGYPGFAVGEPLPEEAGLFRPESDWDVHSDGLEVVARLTGTDPQEHWWTGAASVWAAPHRC